MQKLKLTIIGVALAFLQLTGCSKGNTNVNVNEIIKSSANVTSEDVEQDENTDDFALTIWNDSLENSYIEGVFKEMYPKDAINVVNVNGKNSEELSKAIIEGKAPDIIMQYADEFGEINAMDAFEDLSQAKYINDIKSFFSEKELEQGMSFDSKKLIALPLTVGPMVTYYRTDILEQYGIPTDPNELGYLMETSEGWLTIARELKKDNVFALQWKDEFAYLALSGYGYFDKDMNLNVDNEKVREAVKITKEAYRLGLMDNYDIWNETGKKAIRDGKIAMVYLHKWGADYIKEIAPETAGKWRATRLPLGISSYSGTNNILILSASKHKKQAWELVKKLVEGDKNHYASIKSQENEFLGGQKANLLYEDLASKLPLRYPTILDDKVKTLFLDNLNNSVNGNSDIDIEDFLNSTKFKINNSINHEQKALVEYVKENREP